MAEDPSAAPTSTPARVLVVDDHPIVIDGVRRLLAETDDLQLVGEAADPAFAEEQARRLQPDIVILDLKLGEHLAPPLCRTLLGVSPGAAIVIHTAFDDPEPLRACLNAGGAGLGYGRCPGAEVSCPIRLRSAPASRPGGTAGMRERHLQGCSG